MMFDDDFVYKINVMPGMADWEKAVVAKEVEAGHFTATGQRERFDQALPPQAWLPVSSVRAALSKDGPAQHGDGIQVNHKMRDALLALVIPGTDVLRQRVFRVVGFYESRVQDLHALQPDRVPQTQAGPGRHEVRPVRGRLALQLSPRLQFLRMEGAQGKL